MLTLVDGYNLLFSLDFKAVALKEARELVIAYVQSLYEGKKGVWIVFDGKQEKGLGFSRIKKGSLEVIYTIDGMSADEYIIEWLHTHPKEKVTVVTNDLGLKKQLTEFRARVIPLNELKKSMGPAPTEGVKSSVSDPRYEKYLLETFTKKLL